MNRWFKTAYALPLAALLACGNQGGKPKSKADNTSLTEQLEDLKGGAPVNIADLPGKTETEKFLYLIGVPTATKSGILIFLDAQIDSFDAAGNKKQADALRENRKLLVQAADETMSIFVEKTAAVYDAVFTPEEISQLTAIFTNPIMQKYTQETVSLQQKLLPGAEKWGTEHVAPRYEALIKQQAEK